MKSLLAILAGLLGLGLHAQAGDAPCNSPAIPVAAHVVHCHTTSCCGHAHRHCSPCAPRSGTTLRGTPASYGQNHIHVANRPSCRPLIRVKVKRRCLPRTIYYRTCYASACY